MLGSCRRHFVARREAAIIASLLFIFVVLVHNSGTNLSHVRFKSLGTWLTNTIRASMFDGKKCHSNNVSFWKLPVLSNSSFDPEKCQMISSPESQFRLNIQKIFQDKYFENVTCKPKTAHEWSRPHILTALASYPGSGNTWTRHLIEQLTGIQTSSVYCDVKLRQQEFQGECMKTKENSIVVKTHFPPGRVGKKMYAFRKAVLIIRNPFDALVAFFQFQRKGHTGVVPEEQLNSVGWKTRVRGMIGGWKRFNLSWLTEFNYSVHPLLFENLLRQETFFYELFKLCKFLNIPITYQTLWCVWVNREGKFHRKNNETVPSIARYNSDIKQEVIEAITEVNDAFIAKFDFNVPFFNITMTA